MSFFCVKYYSRINEEFDSMLFNLKFEIYIVLVGIESKENKYMYNVVYYEWFKDRFLS